MSKILYVILDGLGDRPIPALGDRTPLEAASTPHLDALAEQGQQGLVVTVGEGIAPESDVAVFAILGYDPHRYHTGRGVLEALGLDLPFRDGDLALRGNFATAEGERIVDRRVGRDLTSAEARALAEAIQQEVRLPDARFRFAASIGHRCVLVLSDARTPLSAQISNTDPAYARVGGLGVARAVAGDTVERCVPLVDTPQAVRAAELINEFTARSRAVLEHHPVNRRRRAEGRLPANLILLRDASDHLPRVPGIAERFGMRFACFVEMPVERGIARALGMGVVPVSPSQGNPAAYTVWAERAREVLADWDGLYIHLKGPDEPGHDGDWEAKRAVIEQIDAHFFGPLRPVLDGVVVAVTADHATPCLARAHTDDPVPLLVAGPGIPPDGTGPFGERSAGRGVLGRLRGVDVLPFLVRLSRGGIPRSA
ncbi:MAG: 2,3-bisphosphoglycerate-independent phosphoglycerate mutase [Armatimonadota bacterium]|nr:2,3-bisphosphoglycerate-independent phosphoglycerate mutase [Armatimonadota bacterium]MDR7563995.1 2,3-bisphosphoglycerate-independent phosphoglycerate mutase [Armatimonadota bacterium]MDR7568198.1 2,3-bisphosphoglycerate-independent phosphoglycerate mutase [Armatimonadota bacterium]MDR7602103.1 2,3-bisphosphoglycerate-independent phosphoglycerate mutase [Armatimonadota bacterium]